ncbi:transposase [Arsenicicoccus sp. MKL-02]|uniref:Transposase n=1 Tax=Arsenicicoccus cauae TaxID=2663847 RepID=A0A6I3I948_9MICO|nr:transposase [Arsenicicoccus cauae]
MTECINGLYKTEWIRTTIFHAGPYKTVGNVEYATAGWVSCYNHRRLRSALGYVPPTEYEIAHYAALNPEPQPACERQRPQAVHPPCRQHAEVTR